MTETRYRIGCSLPVPGTLPVQAFAPLLLCLSAPLIQVANNCIISLHRPGRRRRLDDDWGAVYRHRHDCRRRRLLPKPVKSCCRCPAGARRSTHLIPFDTTAASLLGCRSLQGRLPIRHALGVCGLSSHITTSQLLDLVPGIAQGCR
jgi:hypothetical protein